MQVSNYKYRLYPNKTIEQKLESNLEACRFLYNHFIEQGYTNEYEMNLLITELKQIYPELRNYHSKMLQMVSKQVSSIYKALKVLKREGQKVSKPRLKEKGEYYSFTYNQSGFKVITNKDYKYYLWLSKIGYIRIKLHRPLIGNIKQVTIKRSNNNKWYAIFAIEKVYPEFNIKFVDPRRIVGIDLGVKSFIVDSDNNRVDRLKEKRRAIRRLELIQRKISRRNEGSNNYKKAKRWYQRIQERIANRRRDFLHKLSRYYTNRYDVIAVEDLNTRKMLENNPLNTNRKNRTLHKHIQELSFTIFINLLKYKAKLLVLVDPRNTTQECYKCGSIVPKTLDDRIHHCSYCNITIDRDQNSSYIVKKRGIDILQNMGINVILPMEHGEVTPVETSESMKQEAPSFKAG